MLVEFEGQQYEFPDDATDAEIAKALESVTAAPAATAPQAGPWDNYKPAPAEGPWTKYGAKASAATQSPNDDLPPGFSVVSPPAQSDLPPGFSVVSQPDAQGAVGPWTQYGAPAPDGRSVAEQAGDFIGGVAGGIPRGAAETAMLPVTASRASKSGLEWLLNSGEDVVRSLIGAEPATDAQRKWRSDAFDQMPAGKWLNNAASAQDTVREGMDEVLYEPRGTAGEFGQTIGEFMAPGALPGKAARLAPSVAEKAGRYARDFAGNVAAPALLSEGAGQLTEGTAWENPARILGAVAGNVTVAANRAHNAPESVVRRATGNMSDADWQRAIDLQNNRTGIRLTGPEAIAQARGGATALPDVQRVVEGSVGGRAITAPFFAQRPGQVDTAVNDVLDLIAPQAANPFTLGSRAAAAADNAITDVRQRINDSTRPLYQAAETQRIPAGEFAMISSNPSFAAAVQRLRADPEMGPQYAAFSDDSVGVVDAVTKDLYARGESLKNSANPLYGPERAMRSTGAAADARNAASRSSPEYAQALAEQERLRELILGPLESGPVGQVAKASDTTSAGNAILPQNPLTGSGRETAVSVRLLDSQDPSATRGLIRQNLADRYQRAATETQEGGREFAGAKFRKDVAGNAARQEVLDAVFGALPNGPTREAAELLDVLQATGRRKPIGSATAFNNALQDELGGAQSLPGLAKNVGLSLGTYLTKAGDAVQRATMGRNIDSLAHLFVDPRSVQRIREASARRPTAVFEDAARRSALQLGVADR